jgi:NodT family efflux transporter outer membrane factor (OMF) lipoprotein
LNRRRAGALAAALMLAGCAVGPNYQAPAPPAGAAAPWTSLKPGAEAAAPTPDEWWRLYDDPALDAYVREALAANQDIAVAEANLSASRAVLEAARSQQYPSTTSSFGAVNGRDPTTNEILLLTGRQPTSIWLFDAVIDSSYELDLFGRVRRTIEASHASTEAVAAARDDLKVTVAAETARAYAEICALGEELAVANHNLEVVSREADITARRRAAGAGSEFEDVRAETLVAQTRSAIPPIEGQRRAALFQLAALLGRTPARAPVEAQACVVAPKLVAVAPIGDGAALLRRRPDLREAERRLAQATAEVGVATASLYPRVTINGFWGGASSELSALTAARGLIWGVGPTIQWSFPNQSLPRARVHQAKATERAALAAFDSAVLRALKETEQALSIYDAELDHHADLLVAQAKAQRTYEIAHGRFAAGEASQLDLLTAEQGLTGADAAVAASESALAQDQIAIFKALGGGWGSPPPAPAPSGSAPGASG